MEIWKKISGYNKYKVSNFGRVMSYKRSDDGIPRKTSVESNGYGVVRLSLNNKVETKFVHRIVAEHFIPNPHNKPCVNHKDGNKLNNHIDNLEWVTYKENMAHALEMGLIDLAPNRKITDEDVLEIRRLASIGLKHVQIAKRFPVKVQTIRKVLDGRAWSHV